MKTIRLKKKRKSFFIGSANEKFSIKYLMPISKIFKIFGINIDIHKSSGEDKLLWLCNKIAILVLTVFSFSICYMSYPLLIMNGNGLKMRISHILQNICVLLLWITIFHARYKISSLCNKIVSLENDLGMVQETNIVRFCIAWLITIYLASIFLAIYPYDEERYYKSLKHLFPGTSYINNSGAFYAAVPLYIISKVYTHVFPTAFAVFYIILCERLQLILLKYVKKIREITFYKVKTDDFDQCWNRYSNIIMVLQYFELIMSFPVFIVAFMDAQGIFIGLLLCMTNIEQFESVTKPSIFFSNLQNLVNLCAILFYASGVNERDTLARRSNVQLLGRCSSVDILSLDKKINRLSASNEPPFVLTGWGFFKFTRTFILSALGCIMTYALLIINV